MAFPENFDVAVADVGTHVDRTTEELDALADAGNTATNKDRPMTKVEAKAEASREKPVEESYEFEHSGKKVKGTRDQIMKWAQMGYDRPQVMQKFNQDRQAWENEKQKWEKDWGVYRQIDDYAKTNREWWDYIQNNWNNRAGYSPGQSVSQAPASVPGSYPGQVGQGVPDSTAAYNPKLTQLEQQIQQVAQVAQAWQQEKIQQQQQAEDQKLDGEIKSIREQYKDLDWDSPDLNGKSLEVRVLEHAQANGISTFKAAFRDLLYDDLVGRAESQAKIAVAKGIQNKTKIGILSESPKSGKDWQPRSNKNIRQTSYEELESDIREELRQGKLK